MTSKPDKRPHDNRPLRHAPWYRIKGIAAGLSALTIGIFTTAGNLAVASDAVPPTEPVLHTIAVDELERVALIYRPASFEPGNPAVLLLHGGGRSMRKVIAPRTAAAHWLEIADREGVILIMPNGVNVRDRDPTGDRQTWNDPRGPADGRRSRRAAEGAAGR